MDPAANQGPLFGGTPFNVTPSLNLNAMFGDGLFSSLGQMFGNVLEGRSGPGFLPGQMFHTTDVVSYQRLRQQLAVQQAMQAGAHQSFQDQLLQYYSNLYRGMYGAAPSNQQMSTAQTMIGGVAGAFPFLAAQFPRAFDIGTPHGSPYGMATQLFLGSRYAIDPITGARGYSAETGQVFADVAYRSIYGGGRGVTGTSGIRAGMLGEVYNELATRGYGLEAPGGPRPGGDLISGSGGVPGVVGLGIRASSASQISRGMAQLGEWVSAMREVFGDSGNYNAPAAQLVEGLEALTQGGLARYDSARLGSIVRDLRNIANDTGMGSARLGALSATAGSIAQSYGMDQGMGLHLMAGMPLGARAYRQMVGSSRFFGALSTEQAAMVTGQLEASAMSSYSGMHIGAALLGGQNNQFRPGSEGEAVYRAITSGQGSYSFGGRRHELGSIVDRWGDIVRSSTSGAATNFLLSAPVTSTAAIQEAYAASPSAGRAASRVALARDAMPVIRRDLELALQGTGVSAQQVLDLGNRPDAAAIFSNPQALAAALGGNRDAATIVGATLAQIPARHSGLGGFRHGLNILLYNNEQFSQDMAKQKARSRAMSLLQGRVAGLTGDGPIGRALEILGRDPTARLDAAFWRTIGHIPSDTISDAIESIRGPLSTVLDQSGQSGNARAVQDAIEEIRRRLPVLRSALSPIPVVPSAATSAIGALNPFGAAASALSQVQARSPAEQASSRVRAEMSGSVQIVGLGSDAWMLMNEANATLSS